MHFPPMPEKASLRPSYWEDVKATARVNNNLLQIFLGEVIISMTQSAKFSVKQNLVMNRNMSIKLSHFRHLCGNARETQLSVLVRGLACCVLQGRLIAHQSDYKNGHDCSCPMSFPQSAYLFFYFARRSAKAG